jgi:hypothetical protein
LEWRPSLDDGVVVLPSDRPDQQLPRTDPEVPGSPIEPGGAEVVVTAFPGSRASGTTGPQTEAYFVPDEGTGGPVGVAVDLPGTCIPADVAVATESTPSFTG